MCRRGDWTVRSREDQIRAWRADVLAAVIQEACSPLGHYELAADVPPARRGVAFIDLARAV
jgi:hypothetical protein